MQVISAEKQPDDITLWNLDTTGPTMKTIHEWYSKQKGKVVWHKEKYGDEEKMQVTFTPERVLLTNPPKKDETWPWKGKGNFGIEIDNVSTVSGPEEVITPAGKFQAMKLKSMEPKAGSRSDVSLLVRQLHRSGEVGFGIRTDGSGVCSVRLQFQKPPQK